MTNLVSRRRALKLAGAALAMPATARAFFGAMPALASGGDAMSSAASVALQRSGVLRTAEPFGAPSLDPAAQVNTYVIQSGIGEALMRFTPEGQIVPWLAEAVEPMDSLRWVIRLRSGVTFWNGRPVDSDAVTASIERSITKNPSTATLLDLAEVRPLDEFTVMLTTNNPNTAMPSQLSGFRLIIHDAVAAAEVGDEATAVAPVCTGPFMPTEFRARELIRVRRNAAYWHGVPALEEVEMRAVSDGNARLAAVLSRDVDVARQVPPQGLAQARAAGLTVHSTTTVFMYHMYLNNTRPPFDDVTVRQAISLAVDRDALVSRVLGGTGTVATGPYPSFFPFADPRPLPFDPSAARTLLDGVGWAMSADGIRARNGQRLEFSLLTYPQRPELGLLATAIQAMLRDIGVSAQIRQVEQITPIVNARDYDATMYALQTAPNADPGYALNIIYASWGDQYETLGYASPRIEGVTRQLNLATDPAQRQALALQAQEILREEVPAVYLLSPGFHTVASTRVQGYQAHPFDYYGIHHAISVG